ncbi:MAG TPA: S28 family serine protease [Ignavibacteriaceae bacterium]|nr:S28 family serine protease [Ignavibacteriaceae bacterium]
MKINSSKLRFLLCALLIISTISFGQSESSLAEKIKSLPDVLEVISTDHNSNYSDAFVIKVQQPLDHNNPGGETFSQKVILSHINFSSPMVISTEGYAAFRNYQTEPASILNANQIIVENRFFNESKPDSLNWEFLTSEQCAADLHHITSIFKELYKGKWVSTGISKGGQTCLFYRYYYPDDVNATIAYVAPINLAQENPAINKFIAEEVGTIECRDEITSFQVDALNNRNEILPILKKYAEEKGYKFSIGLNSAFEFAVLEYPYSFWQTSPSSCDKTPKTNLTPEEIFEELKKVSGFSLFTDNTGEYLAPLFYQSFSELGYYNFYYNPPSVTDLIISKPFPTYKVFLPKGVKVVYHPEVLEKINSWLQNNGNNIIYINGGNDPWSDGAGMKLIGKTNSFVAMKKYGTHGTRIRNFDEPEKQKIYKALVSWLEVKIEKSD